MKAVLLLLLIAVSAEAHQGMHAPPIDVTNSHGKSHSGFGNYGVDDYDASERLKKSCTHTDMKESAEGLCVMPEDRAEVRSLALQLSAPVVMPHLKNYAASVLYSELKLANPETKIPPPECATLNPAPQQELRASAMSTKNLASASVLMDVFSGPVTEWKHNTRPYLVRLRQNYPLLFYPSDRQGKFLALLKGAAGQTYTSDSDDIFAHHTNMTAINAALATDKELGKKLLREIDNMKRYYARELENELASVCAASPMSLYGRYPAIFNQALLDMTPAERKMANLFLCPQPFYYNDLNTDSDCDGLVDRYDPAPRNPFNPKSKHSVSGKGDQDPPFGGQFEYELESTLSKVSISRKISVNFPGGDAASKAKFMEGMRACVTQMKNQFQEVYKGIAAKNPLFQGKALDFNIELEEKKEADFTIHKCWCSTCKVKLESGYIWDSYIPKNTCRNEFTPAMEAAIKDEKLNPLKTNRTWMSQADAGNLLYSTAGDCNTIKHEILHRLGLPDEYNADYYPFNRIGPHSSVMNSGSEVLERHLTALLSPQKCGAQ